MAPQTFQSFWYGSQLSARERLCLTSFIDQGQNFELYAYDESLSVPDGVTLRDASEIYPENEVFAYQSGPGQGSVSVFSNFFRYKLLYERGGWWVDMDVLYTGEKLPGDTRFFGWQDDQYIGSAAVRFPKQREVIERVLNEAESMGKSEASRKWGKSGPKLITDVLEREGIIEEAKDQSYAYPTGPREARASYLPDMRESVQEKVKGSPFLHLWNEILGRMGIQKDVRPPKGSYLNEKANELNFDWPCPEVQYSAETVQRLAENWQKVQQDRRLRGTLTWKIVSRLNPMLRKVRSGLRI